MKYTYVTATPPSAGLFKHANGPPYASGAPGTTTTDEDEGDDEDDEDNAEEAMRKGLRVHA